MIITRTPEITLKFTQKPVLPAEGKKVQLAFVTENNINAIAVVNRKPAAKQVKRIDDYDDWVGALSGKIDLIEGDCIYIKEASIQIFEKKPKAEKVPANN